MTCKYDEIQDYKTAFDCFKQRFLIDKKSIFRLDSADKILNTDSVQYLVDYFVNNGYGGDASFIDKIKKQLVENPKNEQDNSIKKNAIEVLAHCIWLWRLVPYNAKMDSTKKSVKEILDLDEDLKEIYLDNNQFFNSEIKGIASTGTYYNTNKPFELAFVINFLKNYLDNKCEAEELDNKCEAEELDNKSIEILTPDKNFGKVSITTGEDINGEKLSLYSKKTKDDKKDSNKLDTEKVTEKSASIVHALLHFFKPADYEAIVSVGHKKAIVKAFEHLIPKDENNDLKPEIDRKIKSIKEKLLNGEENDGIYFFYEDKIKEQWDPTILPAKNVIYYGAPGTGKTYELLEMIKRKAKGQDAYNPSQYYKVVQFHPSYNYEDFIDGIKPTKTTENGGLQLELVNGIFKEMCIEAFKELKENKDNPKQFYFVADEINRAELSRVFGELLLCLEEDKRLRYEYDNKTKTYTLKGELIKTQNSSLWEDEHAVVKINNELYFGIPENIYFLGTMNDIDRSIDSFDLALRRRFKWVHKGCDYDVVANTLLEQGINDESLSEYLDENKGRCILLNKYINKTLNLGKSYELGHTYFMRIKVHGQKISKSAYENLFDFEISPLVTEYLRAEYPSGNTLEEKVKEMRSLFVSGTKKDS